MMSAPKTLATIDIVVVIIICLAQGRRGQASSEAPDANQNSEMPCGSGTVTVPHVCGSPYGLRNLFIPSSHLVPPSACDVEDKGYYPHFTGEQTMPQGAYMLAWPESH